MKMFVFKSLLVLCLASVALSCSPPKGWKTKPLIERVKESKLIVHGKVVSRTETPTAGVRIEVRYEIDVLCVLRKDGISQDIGLGLHIDDVEPPLCVSNAGVMNEGSEIIVMLQENAPKDKFVFDDINVQRAAVNATEADLADIVKNCYANELDGRQCPKDTCKNSGALPSYAMKFVIFCLFLVVSAKKIAIE